MRIIVHIVLFVFLSVVGIYAILAQNISRSDTNNTIDIFSVGRSLPDFVPANEIEYLGSPYPERELGKIGDGTEQKYENSPDYTDMLPSQPSRENVDNIVRFPKIVPNNNDSLNRQEAFPYKVANERDDDVVHNIPSIIYPPSEFVDTVNDTDSIAEYRAVPKEVATPEDMAGMKDFEYEKEKKSKEVIMPEEMAGMKDFEYQEEEEKTKEVEIQNPTLVPYVINEGYEVVETTPRIPPDTNATTEIATPQPLPEAEVYAQHESSNEGSTVTPTASYPEDYTHVSVPEELPDSEYVYNEDSVVVQSPKEIHEPSVVQKNDDEYAVDEAAIDDEYAVDEAAIDDEYAVDEAAIDEEYAVDEDAIVVTQLVQGQFIQIASSKDLSKTKMLYSSVNLQSDKTLSINNLIRIWKHPSSEYFRLVIGPFTPSDIGLQLYTWRKHFRDAFTYSPQDNIQ